LLSLTVGAAGQENARRGHVIWRGDVVTVGRGSGGAFRDSSADGLGERTWSEEFAPRWRTPRPARVLGQLATNKKRPDVANVGR